MEQLYLCSIKHCMPEIFMIALYSFAGFLKILFSLPLVAKFSYCPLHFTYSLYILAVICVINS